MDNWRDFEQYAVLWFKLGNKFDSSMTWYYVAGLFTGFAAATRNRDCENDCWFIADLCRIRGGLK